MSIIIDMSRHMRTTIRLDDALLDQARRESQRRKVTLTALISEGLRLAMARGVGGAPKRLRVTIPVCRQGGGPVRGVDLDDSAALLDAMEGES
jgi:Arc/MetJ family transcription regulator